MKALGLTFCLLLLSGLAQAQSWTLYYSDTEVVNGDGSVTITPTVLLWGDDGGSCSELDGQVGYDTPAVVLNGNAWVEGMTVLAGGVEGNGGIVEVSYTFPNVTLPANGTAVDLSFGGKVQQACGTQSTIWGSWPWGWSAFFLSNFVDGSSPSISPAPCLMSTGSCSLPWPSLYASVPQRVINRDIDSQQVGQTDSAQVPAGLIALSGTTTISLSYVPTCNDAMYGIAVATHYQVVDQNGANISSSNMEPQEQELSLVFDGVPQGDPLPNWGDLGPSSYPGTSKFTDTTGRFWDAPIGSCATQPYSLTETQNISVLLRGQRYVVRSNSFSESSSSPSHGTFSNGVDVSLRR